MKIFIKLLILIIIIFMILNSNSITWEAKEIKKLDTEYVKSIEPAPSSGVSQEQGQATKGPAQTTGRLAPEPLGTTINQQIYQSYLQQSQFPIIVNKYDLFHDISEDYKSDTICIFIQVANIGDKDVEDLNIYEIIPEDMKIVNCSIPIKATSIEEFLRYIRSARREPYLIAAQDITNPLALSNKIFRDDPPYHLKNHLKENFSSYLGTILNNKNKKNQNSIANLKQNISNNLNKAISNNVLCNLALDNDKMSLQTRRLLNDSRIKQKVDRLLLNYLILRDIYPSDIRKPDGFFKVGENPEVDEAAGTIHVSIPQLSPKESLMFMYYIRTYDHQTQKINTILDIANSKYPNLQFPLDVTFQQPKFNVRVFTPKTEIQPGETIIMKYIVDLLSPTNISKKYTFSSIIDETNKTVDADPQEFNFVFQNGNQTCNRSTNVTIYESGTFNVPSLIINGNEYFISDKYIKVEPRWHTYVLEITLFFTILALLIGPSLTNYSKYVMNSKYPTNLMLVLIPSIIILVIFFILLINIIEIDFFPSKP
jgi:hypothetical protein